ncbi:unnamed protein product, partial [Effrenium voratum]
MPVELSFQCYCSEARPGDQLRVVGSASELGSWDPWRGLVLQAAQPPLWRTSLPALLKSPGRIVEYKYVLLGKDGVEWEEFDQEPVLTPESSELQLEDLGFDELPRSVSLASDEEPAAVVNRRIEIQGDCVVMCSETFGQLGSTFKATWPVGPDWGPDLAGQSAVIGRGKHRNSKNPLFELQYQLPVRVFVANRRG